MDIGWATRTGTLHALKMLQARTYAAYDDGAGRSFSVSIRTTLCKPAERHTWPTPAALCGSNESHTEDSAESEVVLLSATAGADVEDAE